MGFPNKISQVNIQKSFMLINPMDQDDTLFDPTCLMSLATNCNNTTLILGGKDQLEPITFVDASWAGEMNMSDGMKSRHGMVMKLGQGSIMWWSRVQPKVALSSAEAEYTALSEVIKDVYFIKSMLQELGRELKNPVTLYEDSNACSRW